MIKHIVLFKLKTDLSSDEKKSIAQNFKNALESLKGKIPCLLSIWTALYPIFQPGLPGCRPPSECPLCKRFWHCQYQTSDPAVRFGIRPALCKPEKILFKVYRCLLLQQQHRNKPSAHDCRLGWWLFDGKFHKWHTSEQKRCLDCKKQLRRRFRQWWLYLYFLSGQQPEPPEEINRWFGFSGIRLWYGKQR